MLVVIELSREESLSSCNSNIYDDVISRMRDSDVAEMRKSEYLEKNYSISFLAGDASNQLNIFSMVDSEGATSS